MNSRVQSTSCEAQQRPLIAADIETTGLNRRKCDVLCVGFSAKQWEHTKIVEWPKEGTQEWYKVKEQLEREDVRWLWHNGQFDCSVLRHKGINARIDEDLMLMSYALDETGGIHDLDTVAYDAISAPPHKDVLDQYLPNKKASYALIPKPVLHKYLAEDSGKTFDAAEVLRRRLENDPNALKLYTRTLLPATELLMHVESNGFWVNQDQLAENERYYSAEVERLKKELQKIAGYEINPNSPRQLQEYIFGQLKLPAKRRNTREDNLKPFAATVPFINVLMQYRKVQKLYSTYVKGLRKRIDPETGRIYASYKLHGTVTGRLASSDPNMQNIPRLSRIRQQFGAPPGRRIIKADLSQAELRSLAILSRDPNLGRIYLDALLSLHDEVATELFGPNFNKEQKMRAKAVNFGIVYGREAPSIADEFKIPVSEAQGWIDTWFNRFPQAHEFIMMCRKAAVDGKTLITPFGRQRRFPVVTYANMHSLQNEAANFPHQSIASDITLHAAMKMLEELSKLDAFIINLVHDEVIVECPDDDSIADQVAKVMVEALENVHWDWLDTNIPMVAEPSEGYLWGSTSDERWKEAA